MDADKNELFPIFLKAHQLKILIVGGGSTAYEKLFFMLKSSPNADVRLVASSISEDVRNLANGKENIVLAERKFKTGDLWMTDIIIAATNDRDVNEAIRQEARKRQILVNVADTPELCDFYLGSIVTKGDLKIAISTNGKSPTFAKRFRQMLEETLPESIPEMLINLRKIRDKLKGDFGNKVRKLNEITSVLATK